MLDKKFQPLKYSYFSKKISLIFCAYCCLKIYRFDILFSKKWIDISCKLTLEEMVCIECQTQFNGKNKNSIFTLLSAVFA